MRGSADARDARADGGAALACIVHVRRVAGGHHVLQAGGPEEAGRQPRAHERHLPGPRQQRHLRDAAHAELAREREQPPARRARALLRPAATAASEAVIPSHCVRIQAVHVEVHVHGLISSARDAGCARGACKASGGARGHMGRAAWQAPQPGRVAASPAAPPPLARDEGHARGVVRHRGLHGLAGKGAGPQDHRILRPRRASDLPVRPSPTLR
jgi:hypothetical protein